MEALPPQLAMSMAITQQNVALSIIKQTAQMQAQIADILMAGVSGRGNSIDISA